MEPIDELKRIKKIYISLESLSYCQYFPNLEEVVLERIDSKNFRHALDFAKKTKLKISITCNQRSLCLDSQTIGFPPNIKSLSVRNFKIDGFISNIIIYNLKSLNITYFSITTAEKIPKEWFDEYLYVKSGNMYFFTERSHHRVIIGDIYDVSFDTPNFETNCDCLEFRGDIGGNIPVLSGIRMKSIYLKKCSIGLIKNNEIDCAVFEDCSFSREFIPDLGIKNIFISQKTKPGWHRRWIDIFDEGKIQIEKLCIEGYVLMNPRCDANFEIHGDITFIDCFDCKSKKLKNVRTDVLTKEKMLEIIAN
jgi:hypothetical protein